MAFRLLTGQEHNSSLRAPTERSQNWPESFRNPYVSRARKLLELPRSLEVPPNSVGPRLRRQEVIAAVFSSLLGPVP